MQMIIRYTLSDFATFRRAFDADSEDRSRNGLSLLQLWREDPSHAWALFQVNDARAAKNYLAGAAKVFESQAGVSASDAHLVETA